MTKRTPARKGKFLSLIRDRKAKAMRAARREQREAMANPDPFGFLSGSLLSLRVPASKLERPVRA